MGRQLLWLTVLKVFLKNFYCALAYIDLYICFDLNRRNVETIVIVFLK